VRGDSRTTQNARNKWMNSIFFFQVMQMDFTRAAASMAYTIVLLLRKEEKKGRLIVVYFISIFVIC
jgi:hypothetical protein